MKRSAQLATTMTALAGLMLAPACKKKDPAQAADAESPAKVEATVPAKPKYATVADLPEAERTELDAFGKQLEADIRAQNLSGVKAAFHVPGLVDTIVAGVQSSGPQFDQFKRGMAEGMLKNLDFIGKTWSEGESKYKHMVVVDGQPKLRFRFSSDTSGITIVDIVAAKKPNGKLGIVDFYNQALGTSMSDQGRQAAIPALAELDKGFLQRMMGKSTTTLTDLAKFGEMSEKFRNQDFKGAIDGYNALAPNLKTNLAATAIYLNALQQTGDDEGYKNALKEAAKVHKSANFQFMLVDLYFLEKDFDKAIGCLDAFMTAVEKDAALLTLKGLLQLAKEDKASAQASIKEALTLEPDCEYAHVKGLDIFLGTQDFAGLAASMKHLEEKQKFTFKGNLTDPMWADFLKSPESAPWR